MDDSKTIINTITKLFYTAYYNLLVSKNENNYILQLNKINNMMNMNNKTIIQINNIKKMIFSLENKFKLSFKISLLLYIKSDLMEKINKYIDVHNMAFSSTSLSLTALEYLKINNYMNYNKYANSTEKMEQIIMYAKYIKILKKYIHAFKLISNKQNFINDYENINNNSNKIKNKYEHNLFIENKKEIVNRLILLVNNFGIKILKIFNVELIDYITIDNMDYTDILQYYNVSIKKIKSSLEKIIYLTDTFIEIEKTYVMILITSDPNITPNMIDIIIESDVEET
jgi:hypothetical protein